MHRWQINIAPSDSPQKAYAFDCCKGRQDGEKYTGRTPLESLDGGFVVPSQQLLFQVV